MLETWIEGAEFAMGGRYPLYERFYEWMDGHLLRRHDTCTDAIPNNGHTYDCFCSTGKKLRGGLGSSGNVTLWLTLNDMYVLMILLILTPLIPRIGGEETDLKTTRNHFLMNPRDVTACSSPTAAWRAYIVSVSYYSAKPKHPGNSDSRIGKAH